MPKSDDISLGPEFGNIPFAIIPKQAREQLTEKQLVDYRNKREKFARWLLNLGKNPEEAQGYAQTTASRTADRVGYWERWVWQRENQYIGLPSQRHADEYLEHLAYDDASRSHKRKCQYALMRYFDWRTYEYGHEQWEPERNFSNSHSTQPRDFLTRDERRQIRRAALNYGWLPHYNSYSPEQRERMKPYIADRVEKPSDKLSINDWNDLSSWKFTSLVWTALDAGLRPIEVERARTSWVDTENAVLRIPVQDSAKNRENWTVSLRSDTADALEEWLTERSYRQRYDNTDQLWLTRRGNPYQSQSLGRLLRRLCDRAGIPYDNRQMSWYAIRHSTATYMAREEDLAAAQAQLRHQAVQTTMKYDQAPIEDRRDALDRMG